MSNKTNQDIISNEKSSTCCGNGSDPESFNKAFRLIYKINKRVERIQRNSIQQMNMTPAQYLILRQLWERDELSQIELAKGCSCSKSTITGIIDTMEKNKLIKRIESQDDRRKNLIKLTKKGIEAKKLSNKLDNSLNNCCQSLDEFDIKMLLGLLQKLFDSLKPDIK
ncbi:MAG: MarR family winged helix-turn-helix transcriptional regulator [Promethearchaeota archaeon]